MNGSYYFLFLEATRRTQERLDEAARERTARGAAPTTSLVASLRRRLRWDPVAAPSATASLPALRDYPYAAGAR